MTDIERKERIDQLNSQIKEMLSPSIFTLNNTILELQREIYDLQNSCNHKFHNGFCEYCYKKQEDKSEDK